MVFRFCFCCRNNTIDGLAAQVPFLLTTTPYYGLRGAPHSLTAQQVNTEVTNCTEYGCMFGEQLKQTPIDWDRYRRVVPIVVWQVGMPATP